MVRIVSRYRKRNNESRSRQRSENNRELCRGIAMTRGRHPDRALEKAEKIAIKRGLVHLYKRRPGLLADFSITTRELKAEVKIKRLRRIRTTASGLEREAAEEIAGLRLYPASAEISRELWIYSPDYFWRFFRVTETGLVEIARDGSVLQHKAPPGTPASGSFVGTVVLRPVPAPVRGNPATASSTRATSPAPLTMASPTLPASPSTLPEVTGSPSENDPSGNNSGAV